MSYTDDVDASELEWRTADAVADEHRWMACTLVARVLGAGEDGLSIAMWCEECAEEELGGDPYQPFGLLWAISDAAGRTGLALPWELQLRGGDLVLALTDREAATRLLVAMDQLPRLDHLIDRLTSR